METRDPAHAEEIFRAFATEGSQPVRMPGGALECAVANSEVANTELANSESE